MADTGPERDEYYRQIYKHVLGQLNPDEAGIEYWKGTGLTGTDLIRQIQYAAGLDTTPMQDPAYSAFYRNMLSRASQIETDRQQRNFELDALRQLQAQQYGQQRAQGYRDIDSSYGERGMLRAGRRITDRSRLAQRIAGEQATSELDVANRQAELNRQAAAEQAELGRRRIEEEVGARQRLTQTSIGDAARRMM